MNTALYDQDYYLWLEQTVQLLKEGRLSEVDVKNIIEEIEDMGKSQKNALESNLIVLLTHLLRWKYQPKKRYGSWKGSIREHRRRILRAYKDSPSLKQHFTATFDECYEEARKQAADETGLPLVNFPVISPLTPENVLNSDYLPD